MFSGILIKTNISFPVLQFYTSDVKFLRKSKNNSSLWPFFKWFTLLDINKIDITAKWLKESCVLLDGDGDDDDNCDAMLFFISFCYLWQFQLQILNIFLFFYNNDHTVYLVTEGMFPPAQRHLKTATVWYGSKLLPLPYFVHLDTNSQNMNSDTQCNAICKWKNECYYVHVFKVSIIIS